MGFTYQFGKCRQSESNKRIHKTIHCKQKRPKKTVVNNINYCFIKRKFKSIFNIFLTKTIITE